MNEPLLKFAVLHVGRRLLKHSIHREAGRTQHRLMTVEVQLPKRLIEATKKHQQLP